MTTYIIFGLILIFIIAAFIGIVYMLRKTNQENDSMKKQISEIFASSDNIKEQIAEALVSRKEVVKESQEPTINELPSIPKTQTPERISFPSLEKGEGKLEFIRTQVEQIPDNLIPIQLNNDQKSQLSSTLSSITGVGIGVGAQALAVKGLYRASVSASQLMKYADGSVSSMIKEGGRFVQHAGFTSVGFSAVAPMAIFQAAAAITGQYYMNIITKQLNQLNESIQKVIQKIEAKNRAELRAIQATMSNLAHQDNYTPDDITIIRIYMLKSLSQYYNYVDQIKKKKKNVTIVKDSLTWAKDIRKTKENLEKTDIQYLNNMANMAYSTYLILELIYLKMICSAGQSNTTYLSKISSIINSFRTNQFKDLAHIEGLKMLKDKITQHTSKAKECAASYKDEINEHERLIKQFFSDIDNSNRPNEIELNNIHQNIVQRFDQKQELYYDATDPDNIKVYYNRFSD